MVAFAHPQRGGVNGARTLEAGGPLLADQPLRLKIRNCGRVGYIGVSGPLDLGAIPSFKAQMQQLLDTGCRSIILDLSGVQFVNSEGVRALLAVRDAAEKRQARLRMVVAPNSAVERTLRLLRFDSLFSLFRSAAAAWRRRNG